MVIVLWVSIALIIQVKKNQCLNLTLNLFLLIKKFLLLKVMYLLLYTLFLNNHFRCLLKKGSKVILTEALYCNFILCKSSRFTPGFTFFCFTHFFSTFR